jgi:replicative DNA helicase
MSNVPFNSSINDMSYLITVEKAVISSMLFNYEEVEEIFENIKYFMFYSPIHQEIVKVIETLFHNGLPIDENFIISRCDNKLKLAVEQSLLDIMTANPITNVLAYCKEIIESFKRREIRKLLNLAQKNLLEENQSSDDILAMINTEKEKIENLEIGSSDVFTLGELADIFDKEAPLPQIPTGIQWIDSPKCLDGGFEAPNFIFLSGEKETGKTYLATTILENMADAGHKVGFFPLEFGAKAYWKGLKVKYPHTDNKKRINCRKNIYIEANVFDILDIVKKIKRMHKKGVRFVFIDSKLRLTHKNFKGGTLAQMLSEIFSMLGTLTVQLEMAIMIVVQMPKENYASGKLSVKDCVDADHEAKVWINIKVDEKTGLREITMGKNKQNYKRLGIKVKFDPISHSFIKVKDLIEEEENGINEKDKKNKYKKIGESGGIPVYGEGPEIIEYKSDDNDENTMVEIPDFL